ncbi:polyprenol monophosphomannose synthase [Brumimicrobium aurantiacum]|uniref:Polyprenol monophosphomannose synthase n=1 Tax=Brumimicrobium aurantiacum TaxID=1737063 RepID=A0A3E1F0N5_9FLAO|nr:polyprenol monophosphomannose synthase [Brumimicrobium aurantiacum]RFC55381.1 polyprenol monophosphomannose synthase [Brumimicrobium aurantiacum]
MSDSIIIIPTYNEIENIERMIRKVFSYKKEFHLLIVDDNSPDGTAQKVIDLQKEYPTQLHLLQRPEKNGLGTAYKAGFDWCLDKDYEYLFEMDADFSHNPDDLIRLYEACSKKDIHMAIGSRYCKGGKVKNWPIMRVLMSYFASIYVRMILWIGIKDTTAGFKCYSKEALQKVNYHNIPFKGYAFQICMKYGVLQHKLAYKEVPITFIDRQEGTSKMSSGIFKEALFGVWKMKKMKL